MHCVVGRSGGQPHKYNKGREAQHLTVANTVDNPDWREEHKSVGRYNNTRKNRAQETL